MLYPKYRIINGMKPMQSIFITQLRGVQKLYKSRNRKIMHYFCCHCYCSPGQRSVRGLRAQCPIMAGKQREKSGPR